MCSALIDFAGVALLLLMRCATILSMANSSCVFRGFLCDDPRSRDIDRGGVRVLVGVYEAIEIKL